MNMSNILLEMRNITKIFPGVKALDNVNMKVKEGEIHALVGENGAGKSTLMNILSGVYIHGSYMGDIFFKGKTCQFKNIKQSEEMGIVIIHQELALIPHLSIAENIFLGNEQARKGIIDWNETVNNAGELLKKVNLHDSPTSLISHIGVGKQQSVEIAKALSKKVKLLILDEPTSALNDEDSQNLLNLLLALKEQGITSILISHKLNEIFKVADSITILRDGTTIETLYLDQDEVTEDRIIKGMVGRELRQLFPKRDNKIGETIFEVKDWNVYHPFDEERKIVNNVNFYLRKGEVVGIAGLMGAGRTELAMSIFGKSYGKKISGTLYKNKQEIRMHNVPHAIKQGIAYVTEDRRNFGLVLNDDIKRNISLASLEKISNMSVVNENEEISLAITYKNKMKIKCASLLQKTANLSGGNQQKVVLSKWISTEPDILILDEPTRGIDVGAKHEIYTIINKLVAEGKGIILISSELPEVLEMSDRIYVMSEGCFTGELSSKEATQEKIMKFVIKKEEV
jgi:putative multiple sugar transport system ATP-binding protein